jgi:hypothetical protein
MTHEIMRKLTAALAKVDSGTLRHFERVNLVAEAFGWKGDALMHHLKKGRRHPAPPPAAVDPSFGLNGPASGSISLFVGTSPATRRACIGTRAAALAEELTLPVYGESDTWRVGDRLLPTGIIMISLQTIDDWWHAVKLARMGNRVLADTCRAEDDLQRTLPLLGALPEEMAMVSSVTRVAEYLGEGGRVWSTCNERTYPFRLD